MLVDLQQRRSHARGEHCLHHRAVRVQRAAPPALLRHADQLHVQRRVTGRRDRPRQHQPRRGAHPPPQPFAQRNARGVRHQRPRQRELRVAVRRAVEDRDVRARLARHVDEVAADAGVEQLIFDHPPALPRREPRCQRLAADLLERACDVDALAADVVADGEHTVRVGLVEVVHFHRLVDRRIQGHGDDHTRLRDTADRSIVGHPRRERQRQSRDHRRPCSIRRSVLPSNCQGEHLCCSGRQQRTRRGVERRSGRRDVIHQQHAPANPLRGERPHDVCAPSLGVEARLRRRTSRASQHRDERHAELRGHRPREQPGLVVAPRALPPAVQRHPRHRLDRPASGHGARRRDTEWAEQRRAPRELRLQHCRARRAGVHERRAQRRERRRRERTARARARLEPHRRRPAAIAAPPPAAGSALAHASCSAAPNAPQTRQRCGASPSHNAVHSAARALPQSGRACASFDHIGEPPPPAPDGGIIRSPPRI